MFWVVVIVKRCSDQVAHMIVIEDVSLHSSNKSVNECVNDIHHVKAVD